MNRFRYVVRSLTFFWRINLAVACGVVAATAVLTGALLVGDSMRGSLRSISLDGLGKIDEILLTDRFFRVELADEIAATESFQAEFGRAESIVLFPNASAIYKTDADQSTVANKVTLIGCENDFWAFSASNVQPQQADGSKPDFNDLSNSPPVPIVLNEPLAEDLGISRADLSGEKLPVLTVQIPKPQLINADNPLGKKDDLYETIAFLEVVDIIPAESIGRFNLHPSQLLPRILFLPIGTVQEALQRESMANGLLVSTREDSGAAGQGTTEAQSAILNSLLRPKAEDLGLIFKKVEQSYEDKDGTHTVFDYYSLSSDQLLLTDEIATQAMEAFRELEPQQVLTYLATEIDLVDSQSEPIPFSMVSAVDFTESFQLTSAVTDQPIARLQDQQIVLNSWAAEDLLQTAGTKIESLDPTALQAELAKLIGQQVQVKFFEPEASHGKLVTRSQAFEIADIAKVVQPGTPFNRRRSAEFDRPPTLANDPDLTPFVPGLTDQASINKWDLPFKTEGRSQDDSYWKFYRTTPKAFVSLQAGQELWKSRFGKVTSIRIPATDKTEEELAEMLLTQLEGKSAELGFKFTPIRRRNVQASSGSTPFDALFLALSFFIIAAALILISLLFRLGVDQKVAQLGALSAVGLTRGQISRLLVLEGFVVSVIGAALGVFCGIAYAKLMVYGLTTWWVGAVMTSFMEFHWTYGSILMGFAIGIAISLLTIWVSVLRLRHVPVSQMLAGKVETDKPGARQDPRVLPKVAVVCFVLALVSSVLAATSLGGEAQAGAFMGGGFLMLTAFLIQVWLLLIRPQQGLTGKGLVGLSANKLALQNASRNPLRSTLTIGLVASATFLIVAVSSFHLRPSEEGTGGFAYIAESSRPIVGDFQDETVREDWLADPEGALEDLEIYSIRYQPGDEAGCNNPFQAQRPKVLGVTDAFIDLFSAKPDVEDNGQAAIQNTPVGFAWGSTVAETEQDKQNPWRLLRGSSQSQSAGDQSAEDEPVPVIIDKNTAMYSLKIFGVGGIYEVEFDGGQKVQFRVVGMLSNSTLQGSLIISEEHFERLFPNVTGYRSFLIRSKSGGEITDTQVAKLESNLAESGFDASNSLTVLAEFLAVQNTYLSTFQTLGAFGMLLGTFGLATVQLRNVIERKKELALMRALGFRKLKLGKLVITEHFVLLFAGMLVGAISAMFSVVPHIFFGDASVPVVFLSLVLLVIFLVGLLSGLSAVISSIRTPLISALRNEN